MAQPSTPQPASTVVLARPSADGAFEIFMNRRPEKMDTYAGVYVFPGGRVESADWSAPMLDLVRGISPADAQQKLGSAFGPEVCLGFWVAAVRELFEEVGILLCVNQAGEEIALADAAANRRIELKRQAIVKRTLDFVTFLESENLYCDLSRVVYFDHWVTPEIYSMRFDTRFYVAALPSNQAPLTRSEEVTHSLWLKPTEALARIDRRDFPILPPTTTVLNHLARLSSWDRLRAEFKLP